MLLVQSLGDSKTHSIPLEWEGAAFSPGAAWVLIFTAKGNPEDPDTSALIQKTSGAGITVIGSTASVQLVPGDTVDLSAATLYCDVQAQHVSTGEVRTVALDLRLKLKRDITRQTSTSVPVITTEPPVPFEVDVTSEQVLGALEHLASEAEIGYLSGVTSPLQEQLDAKQETLVSGINIKTINSTSLLGSGNISIDATVDNSAVNTAIADDPVASRTALDLDYLPATYSVDLTGVHYEAMEVGPSASDITVAHVVSGTGSTVLSVGVVGRAITVTAGSATTNADAVTAVNAHAPAAALVTASVDGSNNITFYARSATNLKSPLSATGGKNKIPLLDDEGDLYLGDRNWLGWRKKDGTESDARIWMWEDHDSLGGELIIDSPNRIALIAYNGMQIGPNDAGRFPRYFQLVSGGYGGNPDGPTVYNPSGTLLLQTRSWNGTTTVEDNFGFQAFPLDATGTNTVLRIYDNAGVEAAGDQLTPGRGFMTGNPVAEIHRDGFYSAGTYPEFTALTDQATITQVCNKYKSIQSAKVTLTADRELVISGATAGMRGVIYVTQDSTGDWDLTPKGGTALDLTNTTANITDKVLWDYDGIFFNFNVVKNVQREIIFSDSDTAAFITAASLTDATQKAAIINLVESLKTSNVLGTGTLWDKSYVLYPFVGGNATAHAVDLKTLANSAAYNGTFGGTVVHNDHSSGTIRGNATDGYFDSQFVPDAFDTLNSLGIYVYCRTASPNNTGTFLGAIDTNNDRMRLFRNGIYVSGTGLNATVSSVLAAPSTNFARHFAFHRTGASEQYLYADESRVGNSTAAIGKVNKNVTFLCNQNSSSRSLYSDANIGFGAITKGLEETEYAAFRTIIAAFQTALGRANP